MQTPVMFLQKQLPTFVKWLAIAKWQSVYYLLAAFDLLTISSGLYLNHQIMDIYTQSIELNRQWAVRLENYSNLGPLLSALNAPGNDVFDSSNVDLESARLQSAQNLFRQKMNTIQKELQTQAEPAQAKRLLQSLNYVKTTSAEMIVEAQLIFSYFRQNQPKAAGRRMATMDRKYHQANEALTTFQQDVSRIQQQLLEEQKVSAEAFRQYEVVIAIAVLVMIGGVTFYGHQLAQKMKLDAQEKEQYIVELQQTEALLQDQTRQLQLTLNNLQTAQLQLVQNEKMSSLGELVAGIAHEINNPVNFIHGNLPHIRDYTCSLLNLIYLYQKTYPIATPEIQDEAEEMDLEFLQEDLVKILDSIKLGTDRIRQIVLSLRNFSRMDEADFKAVNIHEGIDSTLLILEHRLKAQPDCPAVVITKDYGKLPIVECYVGQLNQVFMNILSNAIDALEEKNNQQTIQAREMNPGQITIQTSMINQEWVEIAIADNGIGISEQTQNRIFNPFFTTKAIGKGTGMGMSISYQIITERHNGQLKCSSTIGQGTVFVIQIPIRQQMHKVS